MQYPTAPSYSLAFFPFSIPLFPFSLTFSLLPSLFHFFSPTPSLSFVFFFFSQHVDFSPYNFCNAASYIYYMSTILLPFLSRSYRFNDFHISNDSQSTAPCSSLQVWLRAWKPICNITRFYNPFPLTFPICILPH